MDVERARRESPFGGPVAHGYLTLSLVAAMVTELGVIPPDAATGLNYGLNKVRFIAPVRAGARVRMRASLASAETQSGGRMLLRCKARWKSKARQSPPWSPSCCACLWAKEMLRHEGSSAMVDETRDAGSSSYEVLEQAAQHTLAANPLLVTIDNGHLFLVTSADRSAEIISEFLR
jgi:hypothetical protein